MECNRALAGLSSQQAGLAGAAETVAALQRILRSAHDSINAGQDPHTVASAILDQFVGHVRRLGDAVQAADFRAAGGQPAGASAPPAATPGQEAAAAAQGATAAPPAAAGPPAMQQVNYVPEDSTAAQWEHA